MYQINLIAIPFVLLLAWAKGRGLFRWAIMAYIVGFWSFVPLFMVKVKPIQIYEIPKPIKQFVASHVFRRELKGVMYPKDLQQ
jgi:hypothetical protein